MFLRYVSVQNYSSKFHVSANFDFFDIRSSFFAAVASVSEEFIRDELNFFAQKVQLRQYFWGVNWESRRF